MTSPGKNTYLYAVQDETGREHVSATVEVEKVGDVTAVREGGAVELRFEDVVIERSEQLPGDIPLHLLRWQADDKLGAYVSYPVK